jgi:hypothetical protein
MPVMRKKDLSGPALAFVITTVRDWLPVFQNEERAQLAAPLLQEIRINIAPNRCLRKLSH